MADKMREIELYLRLQIKETERLLIASQTIHDSVAADKWDAVLAAYKEINKRLFG
jgi:hypothetical protein